MIADDLLHFYRYGLTFRRLLFRDMKRYVFLTIALIVLYFMSTSWGDKIDTGYFILDAILAIINVLFVVIGPGIWMFFLYHQTAKVFRRKFQLKVKKGGITAYKRESDLIEILILKIYLERKNIKTREAIEELVKTLKEREEIRERNSFPLYASSFVILFIPVWSATNNSIFKSITTLKEVYIYLAIIGVFIILFNIVVATMKEINKIFIFNNKFSVEELIHSLTALSYEYYILENNLKEDSINTSDDPRLTIKFKVIKNVFDDYYKRYPDQT
ncbi:hypothetical protein [Priestia aryabhattai]|uniref:hypothetical protein n=1 Tax=Priestia aryabhattai TaxID=412384 RepID=UPI002E1F190D|nr:hypothetical protein [Priestia aryabhattai]